MSSTQWPDTPSRLLREIQAPSPVESTDALEEFFSLYWTPLYVFLRKTSNHHDACDSLQGFIASELLEKGTLRTWRRERGKLRTFLLSCLQNFRHKELRARSTQKRGGKIEHVSLDLDWADQYYSELAVMKSDPEGIYNRHWAACLIQTAASKLREKFQEKGRDKEFELFLSCLNQRSDDSEETISYDHIANELNLTRGAVAQRMRVFRAKFEQMLYLVVQESVPDSEVKEELKFVRRALESR